MLQLAGRLIQAEEAVKQAAKQAAIVPLLLERLAGAPDPRVRQLAAVLLRKRVTSHWQHLDPPVRPRPSTTVHSARAS